MAKEYWFNTSTGEVEEGKASGWMDRMGPYASAEEARNAYAIAAERNEAADEDQEAWEDAWDDDGEDDDGEGY